MLTVALNRFLSCTHGTFGVITFGGHTFYTMEEEWKNNAPRVSCIPAGTYVCKRTTYHKGGYEVFEITGVNGRSLILIHIANTEEDVEGCVGLGVSVGVLEVKDEDSGVTVPKLGVVSSKVAFGIFMALLKGVDAFNLVVSDARA